MIKSEEKLKHVWTVVALIAFISFITMGYFFKEVLVPNSVEQVELDVNCDLRKGSCTSHLLTGETVSFSITPDNIPVLRPLSLNVTVKGIKVSKVEVYFVGVDMDMGFNRSQLALISEQTFSGKGILSICSRSKMHWEARVLLQTERGSIMVPFRFFTMNKP